MVPRAARLKQAITVATARAPEAFMQAIPERGAQ